MEVCKWLQFKEDAQEKEMMTESGNMTGIMVWQGDKEILVEI
jgi:hypothetical protein